MPLNRNLPNNRTNDSLLITLTDNLSAVNKVANCVDTSTNLLKVDIEDATISGTGLATETKQDDIISNQTDGSSKVQVLGNTVGDGSGDSKNIHVDGNGNVQTNVVNTVNVAPSNSTNSHITDDPANSIAVGLKGRTTIGTATTETFLLCDSDGHLKVDVVSSVSGDTRIKGNDGNDGSGTDRIIKTDGNGAVIVDASKEGLVSANGTTSALHTMMLATNDGTNLRTLACDASGVLTVDGSGSTQPISASSLPLPSGAATESTLSAAEGHLGTIDTSTAGILVSHYADGDAIGGTDTGVLIMGRNGTNAAKPIHITNNGDVEVEIADFVKGQATKANSFPVVIASDQDTLATSSAQLPASLGQKANSGSISICRSTTAGAFDMSARTTIGTASTTTKLLCSATGKLQVENTMTGVGFSSELTIMNNEAIASGATSDSSVAQVGSITFGGAMPTFSVTATVADFDVKLLCSQDGSIFQEYESIFNVSSPQVFSSDSFDAPLVEYYKVSITNNSVGVANYTVKAGGVGLTMSSP